MSGPSHRIDPRPGEILDRGRSLRFRFDGRDYDGCAGDTIASALAAAGVSVFSRSFKYHRPRGLLCCAGHCPNCLVQVGSEPNVRACLQPLKEGLEVRPQNAWPSLKLDLMALTEWVSRFLPAGFYYKTFIRPRGCGPCTTGCCARRPASAPSTSGRRRGSTTSSTCTPTWSSPAAGPPV